MKIIIDTSDMYHSEAAEIESVIDLLTNLLLKTRKKYEDKEVARKASRLKSSKVKKEIKITGSKEDESK
jgi:hypothetical protein